LLLTILIYSHISRLSFSSFSLFFFFNDPATTEIYTLSLHDALPIYRAPRALGPDQDARRRDRVHAGARPHAGLHRHERDLVVGRSEEHTSELQSRGHLVCRLLLEKKKKTKNVIESVMRTQTNISTVR